MDVVPELLIRVSMLLVMGLGTAALMSRASAATRHAVLLMSLAGSLVFPLAIPVAPRWELGVLPKQVLNVSVQNNGGGTPAAVNSDLVALASSPAAKSMAANARQTAAVRQSKTALREPSPSTWLLGAWLLGSALVLLWLAAGHLRLRRIAKSAWSLETEWAIVLREEKAIAKVEKRVRLASSPMVSTPITWGILAPVILLPDDSLDWTEEHRRVVLKHELAHIARGDAAAQMLAGAACAVYWFHPLVWLTERRLRQECERACDDRVVADGTPAVTYASHLLEVARSARSFGGPGFLSVAMARPSQLEGRLLAVLNESQPRQPLSSQNARIIVTLALILIGVLSGFRAVPREGRAARATTHSDNQPPNVSVGGNTTGNPVKGRLGGESPAATKPVTQPAPTVDLQSAVQASRDSIFEASIAAQPSETLILDFTRSGATLTISAWDRSEVFVKGRLGGRNWRETETSLQRVNGGVRLRNAYTGSSRSRSFSHEFEIKVPRSFNVSLASAGGGISIEGVTGRFSGATGGGEISFDRVSGEADLRTGGGDIYVTNSRVDGSLATGGGAVRIEGNAGNLVGHSGSGDVEYRNSGTRAAAPSENGGIPLTSGTTTFLIGDEPDAVARFGERGIQKHRSGGAISLDEAPDGARVTTGGGPIRIGRSAGEVFARTGGGTIEIGPAEGSVVASTGAGDITVTFRGRGLHAADLTSGQGKVVLVLPRDFNGMLVLETAYTNNLAHKTYIDSDWPLSITETPDWDATYGTPRRYVRAREVIGSGGGTIRVRTVNGNVIVRRGS